MNFEILVFFLFSIIFSFFFFFQVKSKSRKTDLNLDTNSFSSSVETTQSFQSDFSGELMILANACLPN